jgi:hypothetical protein
MPQRWTADRAGCIFAGSSNRSADDLSAAVILLACDEGWSDHDGARQDAEALYAQDAPNGVYWSDDGGEGSQALSEGADAAADWLNEHIAPEGYWFRFDDGFYLWGDDPDQD